MKKYLEPLYLLTLYLFTLHASRFIPRHSGASFAKRVPTRNLVKQNGMWFNREDGEAREESEARNRCPYQPINLSTYQLPFSQGGRERHCCNHSGRGSIPARRHCVAVIEGPWGGSNLSAPQNGISSNRTACGLTGRPGRSGRKKVER